MAPELERRQYTRATIEWPVSIETDQGLIRGSTLNISAAGATIRCPNPPQANKYINVILEIPHLERFLEVGAEVVWSDRDLDNQSLSSRVGVKFTDISDAQRWLISTAALIDLRHETQPSKRVKVVRELLEKALKEYEKEATEK